ncbi:MAG: hypothetical protein ACM31M_06565 [Nitrososphaerota archaeon]
MPITMPSALFISAFDGKKLLVVMTVLAVALTVESSIGYIADFIPEQLASSEGIATFIGIFAVFVVTQYYILAFVNYNNKSHNVRARFLHTTQKIVTVIQYLLAGIILLVILQILISQQYNTILLHFAISISYIIWIVMFSLLAKAFFSWYRSKKNLMILIFALSMITYVINGALGLTYHIDELAKRNLVIRLGDIAVFSESPSSTDTVYQISGIVSYVLTWIATVMLLRPYIEKFGKVRFWIMMSAPMIYYLIEFPLFSLGVFTPSEDSNAMTNILIFSLSAIFAGILFGVAFLSIARTLKMGTAARNYMIIAAYGFVLFYIAGSAWTSQAAYPPYGLISVSFTGLSCYLIYNGLYFSAVSVSQDMTLRQSIRKSVMEQSKLLHSIGSAEMENEIQKQLLIAARKTSESMTDKTGIEASMDENDIKAYVQLVIKELGKK